MTLEIVTKSFDCELSIDEILNVSESVPSTVTWQSKESHFDGDYVLGKFESTSSNKIKIKLYGERFHLEYWNRDSSSRNKIDELIDVLLSSFQASNIKEEVE